MHSLLKPLLVVFALILLSAPEADAARRRQRRYQGPPPTHPVILWSRTLEESTNAEERRVAAFKLSHYSQPIFQPKVITTLLSCMKDTDVQIRVLCTKALGNARSAGQTEKIREELLAQYKAEAPMRSTIVRVLLARKDESPAVQKALLETLGTSEDTEDLMTLLSYFEALGNTIPDLNDKLVGLYEKNSEIKVRRSIVKVLGEHAKGEDKVVELLGKCAQERDTPLALNCLSGLQSQTKKDARAWAAVQNTIQSDDPDVLLATLDVINALPDNKNPAISERLLELIEDADAPDIQEKAILALGVCGDQTEKTVKALQALFKGEKTEEATRIAAALTLGKQAVLFPEPAREILSVCSKTGDSQSLKSACQLGLKELPAAAAAPATTAPTEKPKSDG